MFLKKMTLRNFRNLRAASLSFNRGMNTLIGENGSGKSNVLDALRLLLDGQLPRFAEQLKESDFSRSLPDWRGHWIIVQLFFEELDTTDGLILFQHMCGDLSADNKTGSFTFYFRPKKPVRQELYRLSQLPDQEELLAYRSKLTIQDYSACYYGKDAADFSTDAHYIEVVGLPDDNYYVDPSEEDSALVGNPVDRVLHREVTCTFIKALRDVVSDFRKSDNPLLNLLVAAGPLSDAPAIVESIKELNQQVSRTEEICNLATDIGRTLDGAVGRTFAPAVAIQSALPEKIDQLLRRLQLKVSQGPTFQHLGDLSEVSLGAANLIYLSLKLLEYDRNQSMDRAAHFLLIEEPEAHIHPHIQKTLFDNYQLKQTQVIVSTHSTHISAASRIKSVNVLSINGSEVDVFQPSNELDERECSRIQRYLDAVRTTLLFAKAVCLVEGDAELIIIPAVVKKVFGLSLEELGISLIKMDGTVFEHIANLFHASRLRRRCAILTDSDVSILPLPADPNTDSKAQKKARASQEAGEIRKQTLIPLLAGNPWVEVYFADHTFEVDFILSENKEYFCKCVDGVYLQAAKKIEMEGALRSAARVTAGSSALKLANKAGKGWFALLLAETIDEKVGIPEYIVKGLAFVVEPLLTPAIVSVMLSYRLQCLSLDSQTLIEFIENQPQDCLSRLFLIISNNVSVKRKVELGIEQSVP